MINRAKYMRALHAAAKDAWGLTDPHPLLHQFAFAEFGVTSMSQLSEKELMLLIDKVKKDLDWKKIEALGVTQIPMMSSAQQFKVKQLQKELNWSDEYLFKLTVNKYGYLDWKYLTGREAWSFVNFLIGRSHYKRRKQAA